METTATPVKEIGMRANKKKIKKEDTKRERKKVRGSCGALPEEEGLGERQAELRG